MPEKITVEYDGAFDIAIGKSRKEINWKNHELLWSSFVYKVAETHRTAENHSEYMGAKKTRQDEIKDIGGYVGGYLTGGKRRSNSVLHRQLITLDLDYSAVDVWNDVIMLFDNAAVLYSTHKHSSDKPRYRLIMPLDRPVSPVEYEAISRRIAGLLNIEYFDITTFQPERLMYWPSTSKDGEYVFEFQDGNWLDTNVLLNTYVNWKDTSAWPVSSKINKILQKGMLKQGDPLEKPGVIGAYCRTYDVHEVIAGILSDIYEPTDIENRYSYKEGSTSGGLIVYDNKYAYSHHGTDPAGGKLCNAFDLVRLHKFGLNDDEVREGTPGNKLPSYTAMVGFATKDPKVKKLIVSEKLDDIKSEFKDISDINAENDPPDDSWMKKLDVDRKGNIHSTINNILLIFENDRYFKDKMAYDDFEKCEVALKSLPWRNVTELTRRLIDKDDSNIRHYLETTYNISNATKTKDAMEVLSNKTCFHPVRDYLNSLRWDGEERVDGLLVDYMGAEDSEYTRTVIRKILVAAVARVFQPGVKFDHVLVLVGEQDKKKSSLISALGRQWFSDSFSTVEGKESFEQLQGVWLVEIAELAGLAKADIEKIKHFISKKDDRYRVAFGRRVEKFPRQCVFFATTNKIDFLKDATGDRRYWPALVHVSKPKKDVFKDLTEDEIGQIWAEAVQVYKDGETIYLSEEMKLVAKQVQKAHSEEHPWTGIIKDYLYTKLPEDWHKMDIYARRAFLSGNDEIGPVGVINRTRVCVIEIWLEAIKGKDTIDERSANIIKNIMLNMEGWEAQNKIFRYGVYGTQRRGYFRTEVTVEN